MKTAINILALPASISMAVFLYRCMIADGFPYTFAALGSFSLGVLVAMATMAWKDHV